MPGEHIYAIIDSGTETTLDDLPGLQNAPVSTKAYQGISGALSHYSGQEFSSMPKEEIVRCLLAHQVVVEYLMRKHSVLPVKFGTILSSDEEVRELLVQGHAQFAEALAWVRDKIELEAAATWDTAQVLREVGNEAEITRTREAMASKTVPHTLAELIQLGQMVKLSLDRRREICQKGIVNFLMSVAVDFHINALISDEMVMNVAFLIEKANQQEFDSRVKELNDFFQNQINFRIIGPLPPYSFATVEITRPSQSTIDEAMELLQLGKIGSEAEVKKAYRRRAAQAHPDSRPGSVLNKNEFTKLRRAADLLIAYSRGQARASGSFLINIRGPGNDEAQRLRFDKVSGAAEASNG